MSSLVVCGVVAQTLATIVPASVGPERIAPGQPGAADVAVQPTESVRNAAQQVLDTHCARCHQADRLVGRSKPAKGFGNILDMDALAANPKYVKPGDADRSLIYHVIVRHEMPSDVYQDAELDHPVPEDKDLAALRGWIVGLDDKKVYPIEVANLPHAGEQLPAIVETRAPPTTDPVRAAIDATSRPEAKDPAAPLAQPVVATPGAAPLPADPAASDRIVPPGSVAGPPKEGQAKELMALAEPGQPDTGARRLLISRTQGDLKRLGCYSGEPTGIVDVATNAAIARYNGVLGRGTQTSSITSDLLEELQSITGSICASRPPAPEPVPGEKDEPRPAKREKRDARTPVVPPALRHPPVRVAHEPAERKITSPPRKVAHAPQMRQPSYRQVERRPPPARQAAARPSNAGQGGGGGGGGGGSSAPSTVSGLSGI